MASIEPGAATIHRHILREHDAVLAVADFSKLFEEMRRHLRRWDADVDPLSYVMLRQGLAGAALQLSFKVPFESIGWTFNIKDPPLNCFVTGSSVKATVTGRIFTEDVKTTLSSRLFVQIHRPGSDPSQTVLEVEGLDLLEMFEQYFSRSIQTPTRFLELSDEEIVMVQGLPRVDPGWIRSLDADKIRELLAGELESVETKDFRFECGCDPPRVARALARIFHEDEERLFGGEEGVESLCPRCGARYWIDRPFFRTAAGQIDDA